MKNIIGNLMMYAAMFSFCLGCWYLVFTTIAAI